MSNRGHLRSPERGVRFAAQLVEAVVDRCLKHSILQESEKGSWSADLAPGVVEGKLHICMLLLLVNEGTQPWCSVRGHLISASTAAWLVLGLSHATHASVVMSELASLAVSQAGHQQSSTNVFSTSSHMRT